MVENLCLLFQDVNTVNFDCFGSLQDWIHKASDKQYWNQLVACLLYPSTPLPERTEAWGPLPSWCAQQDTSPIQHNDIWRMHKKAKASFWTAEEIDLSADTADWNRLLSTKQHFISHVLAFFVASDSIINKNLSSNFATEVMLSKAQCFYGF